MPQNSKWKCSRQPFPCCFQNAKQCGHDRALGVNSPKLCDCSCHREFPAPQVEGATLSRSERIAAEVVSKWKATPDRHYADLISAVAEIVDGKAAQPVGEPSDAPLLTREQYQEQRERPFYPGRDIHRYVGNKAPGQACETCDLSWVHENHGRMIVTVDAASSPTPADEVAQAWQSIETAPRDGTEIILGHGNSVWLDQWVVDSENEARNGEGGYWMMCDQWSEPEIPSHWMPRPSPPLTTTDVEGRF